MKVLITGVAGLIGSHLAEYLHKKGYDVYGVDNLSGGYIENVPSGISFLPVELTDPIEVADIFEQVKPDVVYHLAAYAAEGLSPFIRNFNYTNNLIASVNVINNCIKYDAKLIFTSSMAVYGHGHPPFTEDDLPKPADPYGIAKYAVEMDITQAGEQFGLRYTIVRPHNIIGIYQNIWDRYRNVIGIWIRQVLKNEPITIYGDGQQTRAFSDIKYYLEPFEKLMTQGDGQIYNMGADKEFKIIDVARIFKHPIQHLEARHEVKHAYCDHTKAKNELAFRDNTDLESTIREMMDWAKTQPDREVKLMDYELEKGMYGYWK